METPTTQNTPARVKELRTRVEVARAQLAFVRTVTPSDGEIRRAEGRVRTALRHLQRAEAQVAT